MLTDGHWHQLNGNRNLQFGVKGDFIHSWQLNCDRAWLGGSLWIRQPSPVLQFGPYRATQVCSAQLCSGPLCFCQGSCTSACLDRTSSLSFGECFQCFSLGHRNTVLGWNGKCTLLGREELTIEKSLLLVSDSSEHIQIITPNLHSWIGPKGIALIGWNREASIGQWRY